MSLNMFQTNLDSSMGRHERQAQEPIRRLLLDDDLLDDELDNDNYDDTRAEMRATGHNVTSVLMNPRETLLEDLMDDFASEQSTVLEALHPRQPITAEVEECRRIVVKLRALIGKRNKTLSNTMVTRAPTKEDVEMCFREVPAIFFRPVSAQSAMIKAEDLQEMLEYSGEGTPVGDPRGSPRSKCKDRSNSRNPSPNKFSSESNQTKSDKPTSNIASINSHLSTANGVSQTQDSSPVSIPTISNNSESSRNASHDDTTSVESKVSQKYKPIEGIGRGQQERLSQYLDLVEVALLKQIWSRSPAFFRASDDIRALQEQVKTAGHMISARRRDLQNIAASLQSGAMRIPHLSTRVENQRKLLHKLSAMQRILDGRNAVETLMSVEDHLGALQVTTDTLACFRSECADVIALRSVGAQLQQYEDAIGQVMCDKFASMAMVGDLVYTGEGSPSSAQSEDARAMATLLKALLLVGKTEPALQLYTTRLLDYIKIVVRSCVSEYLVHLDIDIQIPSNAGSTHQDKSTVPVIDDSPFSVRVKEMDNDAFFSCMEMCFEQLLSVLYTADQVNRFIVNSLANCFTEETTVETESGGIDKISSNSPDAADGSSEINKSKSQRRVAETTRAIDISVTCIKSACDASQRYISQFLVLRKESCNSMSTKQMKMLWTSVSAFVVALEKLNSTGGKIGAVVITGAIGSQSAGITSQQPHSSSAYTLRKTLVGIVKSFIDRSHDFNKSKLVSTLDSERWVQCDISAERQARIAQLASGRAFLGESDPSSSVVAGDAATSSRTLMIDNQSFISAWSALLLVEMLMEYIGFAAVFSNKVTEDSVIPKMTELLQLFDTHTHRLVLGAQATKAAAALKSISARHLAVTVQSIGMVLVLLPHARTALMVHLTGNANSLLVELDRISNQYSEHQSKLLTKFVTIVGEAVDASSEKKLGSTDWDRFNGQCEYFEEIVRNVTALHRVLSATLPPEQVQNVFTRIFMHLNRKIPLHFDDIKPTTQTGKQRILDEVSHLVISFQRLPQITASAVTLEETFKKKYDIK